ncbi:pilus assembly protein TadG-related protein [Methylobacterium nigriterrae]|uniref:pilus assembly protein TadG-related protein n=1 Tax=Methylobacterium nigriterrae TaxID=3127512 RepID=UPI0030136C5C
MRWTVRQAARLRCDQSANVAIVFALAALPTIGLLGLGIEHGQRTVFRNRLDAAADAAAIAAIKGASDYVAQNSGSQSGAALTDGAIAAGTALGAKAFATNAGKVTLTVPAVPTVRMARQGQTFTANVQYAGSYPSAFGKLFGTSTVALSGGAASSVTMGSYLDFYLLLDTSGSMGFPTSAQQQLDFARINPDMNWGQTKNNCAFACHFPSFVGYSIAKPNKITLRIETVGNAVAQLLTTAKQNQTIPNQYRVGLFPFVSYMETAADATTDLDSLQPIAAGLEAYMDIGDSSRPRGSGGTHFENLFPTINSKITRSGDGSSSLTPQPFIFLVTDGVQNDQYWSNSFGWTGSKANLLDPNLCTPLKNRGITISVLYIPYVPIAQPYNTNVGYENDRVNGLIPSVPDTLRSCASPGYFRTASTSDEITAALNAMFAQATAAARLTQ